MLETANKSKRRQYKDHRVLIKTPTGELVLLPGPVYCFYSQTKFKRREIEPSFKSFRKRLQAANVNAVVLHGKPLVDPYYLNWRYNCRLKYNRAFNKMSNRGLRANEAKALNILMRQHQAVLAVLKVPLGQNDYEKLVLRVEKHYEGHPELGREKMQELAKLAAAKPELAKAYARAAEKYQKVKEAQNNELWLLKAEWEEKCIRQELKTQPYLEPFAPAYCQKIKCFQVKDVKRLYNAKTRAMDSRDAWKDFYFQMRRPLIRWFTPWNRWLTNAMKRNKRWLRKTPDIDIISHHLSHTKRAVENFKAGFLGQARQYLADPKKTIGHNLVKILMITNECDEQEAYQKALVLLTDLDVYDPADLMTRRIGQFINDDYHYKILLSYLLAFAPETLVVDRSALNIKRPLTAELYSLIEKLQPKYGYVFVVYDDTMFDKDFQNMIVYTVTGDKRIVTQNQ